MKARTQLSELNSGEFHRIWPSSCCYFWFWVWGFQSLAFTWPVISELRAWHLLFSPVFRSVLKYPMISITGFGLRPIRCTQWLMKSYFGGRPLSQWWRGIHLRGFRRSHSCSWQKDLCHCILCGRSFWKGMRSFTQSTFIHFHLTKPISRRHLFSIEDRSLARYLLLHYSVAVIYISVLWNITSKQSLWLATPLIDHAWNFLQLNNSNP